MATTLLLDQSRWDLVLDITGNIALASEPYALAQDVSSACRLFLGELWYDTSKGIPYFNEVLGVSPPTEFLKAQCVKAALTVPTVVEAQAVMLSFVDGNLKGQVQFSNASGTLASVNLSNAPVNDQPQLALPANARLDVDFVLDVSRLA